MKKGHFLGQDQNSGGTAAAGGSSLAVRQFVDLARGWVGVHTPTTPFRVVSVTAEERYCLTCCDVRMFDVISPLSAQQTSPQMGERHLGGGALGVAFCRCCGTEVHK